MNTRLLIRILGILTLAMLVALEYWDYRITQKPLSILIWLVFLLSVTYEIYSVLKRKWVRISVLVLWFLGIATVVLFQQFIAAFAGGRVDVLEEWTHGSYHVRYCRRLDWAGPPYHRYDLDKELLNGLLKKKLDIKHPFELKNDSCTIHFPRAKVTLDRCKNEFIGLP